MKQIAVAQVEQILKDAKVKNLTELMDKIISQSRESFGASANPPKEIDGIMHYFCRYTQQWFPEEEMVFSNGKSKGYSKIGISAWTKVNSLIKKTSGLIAEAIQKDDFDSAKLLSAKVTELKAALNNPATYSDIQNNAVVLHLEDLGVSAVSTEAE